MYNILYWNIRGVGNKKSKKMVIERNISLVSILEPKHGAQDIDRMRKYLKTDQCSYNPMAEKHCWIYWKDGVQVDIHSHDSQALTISLSRQVPKYSQVLISFIYAKCDRGERISLWGYLKNVCNFNTIIGWELVTSTPLPPKMKNLGLGFMTTNP